MERLRFWLILSIAACAGALPASALQPDDPAPQVGSAVPPQEQSASGTSRMMVGGVDSRTGPIVEQALRKEIESIAGGLAQQVAHSVAEMTLCKEDSAGKDQQITDLNKRVIDLTKQLGEATAKLSEKKE